MSEKTDSIMTNTGVELTDEMLEQLAKEWENDIWQGCLSDITESL